MKIYALCNTCNHKHPIEFDPRRGPGSAFGDWLEKHPLHDVDFLWPGRTYKGDAPDLGMLDLYVPNADVKIAYASSAAITCGVASLASSSGLTAGRESNAVDNTSNKYLDYLFACRITVGTTPTTNTRIEVWAYGSYDDTPTYPDVFDGTDSAETVTNAEIKRAALKLAGSIDVIATTSDIAYPLSPRSIASLHGGALPKFWGVFATHNTVAALNATGGNHVFSQTGAYATAI